MKEKELRIGNYVYFQDALLKFDFESGWNFDYIKPIPLTEQWLFKFGFEIGYNKTKMLDVYCKDFGILIERSNGGNFYYKKVYISSVHQLQNLYFALTNEEL